MPYHYLHGLKDGIPIALGYLSVSFAFGISVVNAGFPWHVALIISMTNLTSAGQLAGLGILASGGSFVEMTLAQFIINLRYALMSISLSQKVDKSMTALHRALIGFGITDEIFAVSSAKDGRIGKSYFYGLITLPYIGWALGTFLGSVAGTFLPDSIRSALGIAIYGMFIAIILPPSKKSKPVRLVVIFSALLSIIFKLVPGIKTIFASSPGFVIIICAVIASAFGAYFFPVDNTESEDAA